MCGCASPLGISLTELDHLHTGCMFECSTSLTLCVCMQNLRTPLHWAARRNKVDAIVVLVGRGAQVEARDEVEAK